jgi:hypothetical protein
MRGEGGGPGGWVGQAGNAAKSPFEPRRETGGDLTVIWAVNAPTDLDETSFGKFAASAAAAHRMCAGIGYTLYQNSLGS